MSRSECVRDMLWLLAHPSIGCGVIILLWALCHVQMYTVHDLVLAGAFGLVLICVGFYLHQGAMAPSTTVSSLHGSTTWGGITRQIERTKALAHVQSVLRQRTGSHLSPGEIWLEESSAHIAYIASRVEAVTGGALDGAELLSLPLELERFATSASLSGSYEKCLAGHIAQCIEKYST